MRRVLFIPVKSSAEKILKIVELAFMAIEQRRPLLIKVKDEKAGLYLDELLWKQIPNSFLPHIFTLSPTQEPICITTSSHNLNQAVSLLNLSGEALLTPDELIQTIYELEDTSSDEKNLPSKNLYNQYKAAHFAIALI